VQVFVESSDPIPQFLITPSNAWKSPSEFILDASVSSDVDVTNGYDNLSYEWSFSEEAKTSIVNTESNNQKIKVQFDTLGTHTIKLVAKDDYGKQAEIVKDIVIASILRPEMFVVPIATPWGNPVNFVVKSNLPLVSYLWDFGDGSVSTIQTDKVTHTYKTSGIYKVVLKVSGADGMSNEVTKTVFIGDKDYPVGAFTVLDKASNILTQNESCLDASGLTIPAYQIKRYDDFTMDPGLSVNTKGKKTDLQFYFQPKDNEIFKQTQFKYKFNEL
jgi:PKD repeat protein